MYARILSAPLATKKTLSINLFARFISIHTKSKRVLCEFAQVASSKSEENINTIYEFELAFAKKVVAGPNNHFVICL